MKRIMKDLSIIIVSYNTKHVIGECLESVKENAGAGISYEVIIVDNNSSDGSVEYLKENFKMFSTIANKDNSGFSKANNIGIKQAVGRYVLFLNPDTIVQKDTLGIMVEFMDRHKEVGAATCKVLLEHGQIDDASHRGFPTPLNALFHFSGIAKIFPNSIFFNGYHLGWKDLDRVHEIEALAGAFMIVRREAGDAVGWWDEDYFFYGEDIDFCYKLKEKGWKIYYVPTVSILHIKGVSGGLKKHSQNITTASKETRIRATNWRFDAMKIFYKKHYMKKYPKVLTWIVLRGISLKQKFTLTSI